MTIRISRRSTAGHPDPARMPMSPALPGHTPPTPPAYRLLDPSLDHIPSVTELSLLVSERMIRLHPDVSAAVLERISRLAAETLLVESAPHVVDYLPDLALGKAREDLGRSVPRASHHHPRRVA